MEKLVTTVRLVIGDIEAGAESLIVERLMRPQSSVVRSAYNWWREGVDEKEIYRRLTRRYSGLSSWGIKSGLKSGQAVLASQVELLPQRREYLRGKIEKLTKALERRPKLGKRLREAQTRLVEVDEQINSGKVRGAIFGGRGLWEKVVRGLPGARDEWRLARSGQYYSIGGSATTGNREFRLVLAEEHGKAELLVRVPGKTPDDPVQWVTLNGTYTRAQRYLLELACSGMSFTVRLVREAPGRLIAWITVNELTAGTLIPGVTKKCLPRKSERIAGIDLNLDHLAVSFADARGQYRGSEIFPYNNLGELPKRKSKPMVGRIAKDVIGRLIAEGAKELALEDLSFLNPPELKARYNRRTLPFAFRQLQSQLIRTALRSGIIVKLVHPAFTSVIGREKYMIQFGITVHAAAAFVIARRAAGFTEKLPKRTIHKIIASPKTAKLACHWKSLSPLAGKPWSLWASFSSTLKSPGKDDPARGTTHRRNNPLLSPDNGDHIPPGDHQTIGLVSPPQAAVNRRHARP